MKIINNSDSVIIVLHEIYGINKYIDEICMKFSKLNYDIICPNLIEVENPFSYDLQNEAYDHFINEIGFDLAAKKVKKLIDKVKTQYKHIFILGFSIGATIAWLCSDYYEISGIIAYYGSRIRYYVKITPNCPVLLIFADDEPSFSPTELAKTLKALNVDVHILNGKHGFSDPFSSNYFKPSSKKAELLAYRFLNHYNN
ncbi:MULTISPECIES: dienelactone hydrolase family protein [Clostridium]|uniref:dienelactone hydrolase family protein n=1 Tax=Clostridium TaxID=1485 RepID=UPI0008263BA0|nr:MULTISPECIES: dienelactone hydrolase family protein [Clostridium]PJI10075.1 hypothetical protein CUB90_20340 [Clostridium sp. CT7]